MWISTKLLLKSAAHRDTSDTGVEFFSGRHDVYRGPGSIVGSWAGLSGDRIPLGGEIFHTCPDRPRGPPSLLYYGYRVFPGGKEGPGRDADPSPPSSAVVKKV
jgi:hypothetical protein